MISSEVEGKQIGNKGYIEAKTYLTLSVIEITNDICLLALSWFFYPNFWSYTIENFASPSFPKIFRVSMIVVWKIYGGYDICRYAALWLLEITNKHP